MKKISLVLGSIILVGISVFSVVNYLPGSTKGSEFNDIDFVVYKTPTCGCCGGYISYLKKQGVSVVVEEIENLSQIKKEYNIPIDMESCHTSIVGNYVVEGHVPVEAIEKLIAEKPAIKGIALPGMPAGSPGMSGTKLSRFKIHSINLEGEDSGIFTEI